MNNFNFLAPVYDALARLIFGQNLHHASTYFLGTISPDSKVLVLGGGTGKILSHLGECRVVYVEKSRDMLSRATQRSGIGEVAFIHTDFLDWESDQQFDVVICPFFLDVFTLENLSVVLNKIAAINSKGGTLIVTDFQKTGRFYHRIILSVMHLFFRFFSRLESKRLSNIESQILRKGYEITFRKTFLKEFIFSAVYQR